jgi:hypothetical protein
MPVIFDIFDGNKDGFLSQVELQAAINHINSSAISLGHSSASLCRVRVAWPRLSFDSLISARAGIALFLFPLLLFVGYLCHCLLFLLLLFVGAPYSLPKALFISCLSSS